MNTLCLPAAPESIAQAAALLRAGQVVGFPTETVYGLGADALNEAAVRAIFAAKERPADNPLIVHVAEPEQLAGLCQVTPLARELMRAFWPGPLTLLLQKTARVPDVTTAGLSSVAVRCPNHPVAHALLRECGAPVAAPSANRSGRPSPTAAAHVLEDMDGRIELILDGGACDVGVESTVVDMTGATPRILRPGGVTAAQIAAVAARIRDSYDAALNDGRRPLILALDAHRALYGDRRVESLGDSPEAMAHSLFAVLRDADTLGADALFSEAVEADGVGLAVMNRLGRAAAFHIVEV